MEAGIAAGYRHIDTAHNHHNEVDIGRAPRSKIQQGIIRREDMFITSKVGAWGRGHQTSETPYERPCAFHLSYPPYTSFLQPETF